MKFSDVPQFTKYSGWNVQFEFRAVERQIKEWEAEAPYLDIDPDFQRGHVWDDEKRSRYIEYVLRGGNSSRDIWFNHTNWNTDMMSGSFVLVDGLQRLTAVRKFMNDELPVFNGLYLSDFDGPRRNDGLVRLPMHCYLTFRVNNLQTRAEVLQWYIDLNEGGVVHSKEEIERVKALLAAE